MRVSVFWPLASQSASQRASLGMGDENGPAMVELADQAVRHERAGRRGHSAGMLFLLPLLLLLLLPPACLLAYSIQQQSHIESLGTPSWWLKSDGWP